MGSGMCEAVRTKTAEQEEERQMTKSKKENTNGMTTRKVRDPNAPPVKRPRSGTWMKVSKQIPIPGCFEPGGEASTTNLDFYQVEFAGEMCEVRCNREGVKKGNAWIKSIKSRGEEELKIDRIRRQLEEMSEAATTQEMTARLYQAAQVLRGQDGTESA